MGWYRFHDDAVGDQKIAYVAEITGKSELEVMGAWAILLCLANKSPIRGKLLITSTIPMTFRNVSETFHETIDETKVLLQAFETAEMIHQDDDGCWCITNWSKRQFESDLSTERVRKHREMKRDCNVSETPHKQKHNQSTKTDNIEQSQFEVVEGCLGDPDTDPLACYRQEINPHPKHTEEKGIIACKRQHGAEFTIRAIRKGAVSGAETWTYISRYIIPDLLKEKEEPKKPKQEYPDAETTMKWIRKRQAELEALANGAN
mgnify:CR=1 FL=1